MPQIFDGHHVKPKLESTAVIIIWIVLLMALAAYAALIEGGHWNADEYYVGWAEHQSGFIALWGRMLHWSPRPVAELVAAAYLWLAQKVGHSLIVPLLAGSWAGTICLLAGVAAKAGEQQRWLLAVMLVVAMLMIGHPDELFYWPMATIAYLTAWAGLAGATLLIRNDMRSSFLLSTLLVIAALSVEVAALAILLASSGIIALVMLRRVHWQSLLLWLPPLAASLLVCLLVKHWRMAGMGEIMDRSSAMAGNWPRDLVNAAPPFLRELVGVDGLALLPGLGIKAVILSMLPLRVTGQRVSSDGRWPVAIWTSCLLMAAYASIVLALHQFGTVCCVRHATMRQGMYLLAALGFVSLLPVAFPAWIRWPGLAVAFSILLLTRMPALRADLELLPAQIGAREATWKSGRASGQTMHFVMAPPGDLSASPSWPAQTICVLKDRPPFYGLEGIAAFFNKQVMIVRAWDQRAFQSHQDCGAK